MSTNNDMIERSLANGDTIEMSDRTYRGRNPQYTVMPSHLGMPAQAVKTAKGIPFVRARAA